MLNLIYLLHRVYIMLSLSILQLWISHHQVHILYHYHYNILYGNIYSLWFFLLEPVSTDFNITNPYTVMLTMESCMNAEQRIMVNVTVVDDQVVENTELFGVMLSSSHSVVNITSMTSMSTVTVEDDDGEI